MILDHEKFEGIKELAEISTKISAGTAALAQLKVSENEYIAEREARLVEKLQKALVDSADLIKSIGQNHGALVGYKNEVEDFYQKVLSLIQGVNGCMDLIETVSKDLETRINEHETNVEKFKDEVRNTRIHISNSFSAIDAATLDLNSKTSLLNDRKAMFERALRNKK